MSEGAPPLAIGITCYPSIGGSGVLATSLGVELARRGHRVHFVSYERPFRLPEGEPRVEFHRVNINDYGLFRYPDYTLPLSVTMAEVARRHALDVMHVHYAVPHATAALLARAMMAPACGPKIVTTLHGTDTTLLGHDPGCRPAIRWALEHSDALTAVSSFLAAETVQVLGVQHPIDVVPNFFVPRAPRRTPEAVRAELGLAPGMPLLVHSSNLRPLKRVDLLLEALARVRAPFRLLVLAGDRWEPFVPDVRRLGLDDRVIVREQVQVIEDYLQVADLGVTTSDSESFCLAILEAMVFGCPSVATRVGGIPEVIEDGVSGLLVTPGDAAAFAAAVERVLADRDLRHRMGQAARVRAQRHFVAEVVVPLYEAVYRRACVPGPRLGLSR